MARHTLADRIRNGDMVRAYCHNLPACGHSAELDLVKLAERVGPDHGAMHDDLVPKLKCAKCGGRRIGLIVTPNSNAAKVAPTWPNPARENSATLVPLRAAKRAATLQRMP